MQLPYVLFAYQTGRQEFTRVSHFHYLYGQDPRLPTKVALTLLPKDQNVDMVKYKADLVTDLSTAWEAVSKNVEQAQ